MQTKRKQNSNELILLIWKSFYNYMGINCIEICLFDLNDYRYDFENPISIKAKLINTLI